MGKYTGLTAIIAENMIEGSAFKANGETITVDEAKMTKAKDALGEAVRGLMRDFWNLKESDENSLEGLDGEVKIDELMDKKSGGTGTVPSLGESLNFNIKKVVESIMEEPEAAADGDEDFANAAIGQDDADMGGDLAQDGAVDADAGSLGDEPVDAAGDVDSGDLGEFGDEPSLEGGDGFEDLSFADLDGDSGLDAAPAPAGDEFGGDDVGSELDAGGDMGGDVETDDLSDEGETPIEKPIGESKGKKQPLAKMSGKKR